MGIDTSGRLKGYITVDEIYNYIKNNWDANAKNHTAKKVYCPLSECKWDFELKEHSESQKDWYSISGFISFKYNGEDRQLFYVYENINGFENLEYYTKINLEEMVRTETTFISLGCWGSSVEIIRELIEAFDGGWLVENDCSKEYYFVETKKAWKKEIRKILENVYTNSDIEDFIYENSDVSEKEIWDFVYEYNSPARCKGCEHIQMSGLHPCSSCERKVQLKDYYEPRKKTPLNKGCF